ncbi:uncharacterized protein LOC111314357 isoform X1 [Durio zibethinus]|uniref:Uncharacterized protein LOC111314357 isoform X1 n=1 Tax=Durio zibethinus TaxID=66656 RepID=A0A6P6B2V5_DURZI|nr:uncharacterized protein LOC111314357 isoform X1 [Durio zibethinus]XP_022771356.1 uncharacterized protein LOC111314357 isoform X1 [Durio zibethinus]XP_022771357.1 uncharacterized protein LOC111314357 isoform X1 [Durio zibethinus]XP_022771358.1 uncharacterized protein LOC111314357 isoform X1 [Durio zibethinus]
MESNPIVIDISSDDDEATSTWKEPKGDDYDWLSEVLKAVDKRFDDPDEVVVVGEVSPNKKSNSWNSSVRKVVNENDDDCVVLEGDPNKALSNVNDPQEDSDELLIVGQKGQIACRDFPHPRHDCAKFPFSSTSHEQHCELCHCFVCDMRAPCCYWGSGVSNVDHCHATNKEEIWKTLRKNFRLERNVPIPVAKAPVTSQSTAVPQLNQVPRHDIIQLTMQNQVSGLTPTQATGNCRPQKNHVPRPSIIPASPSSTRFGIPYNPSVGSRHVLSKSTIQPRSVSPQLLGVRDTVIRRDRGIKVSHLGSQFVPSNTISKRLDTEVASAINRAAYAPSENITSSHASQNQQNPASVTISNERNLDSIGWTNICSGTNLGTYAHQSSSQPSMGSFFTNLASSQSSVYSQPVPQSNVHQDTNHLQNQNQPATNYGFSDFDLNWVNNISQSNQQSSVDNLQLQFRGSSHVKEPFKDVNEQDKSYYEFESFLFDNQYDPENSLTAELNPLSPDHISIDTGMLCFDIDTSWDCLTRA